MKKQMMPAENITPPYMQGLNAPQQEAVENLDGPLLVLAGAGTGKTRVLTTRLAHIIDSFKAQPGEILAVTFTNKAAQEMKHRVSAILGGQMVEGWWLGTFHSLAARMLRRHAELVGLTSQFTIIDTDDQTRLLKQLIENEKIDTKKNAPKLAANIISGWKDKALMPSQITQDMAGQAFDGKLPRIYDLYQKRMKTLNCCDFGDLLLHIITIFKNPDHAEILAQYHRRFRYIMVDEYQDTNVAQYLWLRLLAKESQNICCVGDDDQSIYGWRGAEVGNILRFEKDFEGAKTIRLEQNYRSTNHILCAAGKMIEQNGERLGKTLWSAAGDGDKVSVHGLWDGEAEARWVGEQIEQLQREQMPLNQIAILVRAGFLMREFEDRMISLGIPYRVIGGPRFYERQEIRDALAYLRITMQPHDDLALERIINLPKRGIGPTTVQTAYRYARANGLSLHDAIRSLSETDEIKPKQRQTLIALFQDFDRWRGMIETTHHAELASIILDESGYTGMWQADKSVEADGRLDNLKEFISAMGEYETLAEFLEHVALVLDNNDNNSGERVSIMTLHGSKGLEFQAVFLPGWEDGVFPSKRSTDELGVKGLEEERRLAYVGITRARQKCYISFAANRRTYGQRISAMPSRFIDELPADHINSSSDIQTHHAPSSNRFGSGRSTHWDSSLNALDYSAPASTASGMKDVTPRGIAMNTAPQRGIATQTGNESGVRSGMRVSHPKFGTGQIVFVDGNKLDIVFDAAGRKRVMQSFIDIIEE
jgi:DNA helicase-2/ATP-dependent DNA helicase PcrA